MQTNIDFRQQLQNKISEIEGNLAFLDTIIDADPSTFKEMYSTVEFEHIGYWGAEKALGAVRGKWDYAILMRLIKCGTLRYSGLKHELEKEGLTDYMLSKSLKSLIQHKMVEKQVYAEVPVRTEYTATPRAYDYWRIMLDLSRWYNTNLRDDLFEQMNNIPDETEI